MATVTRGGRPTKRNAGRSASLDPVRCGEERAGQGRGSQGLPREEGGSTRQGSGPVLQAHSRLASPSEVAEEHLEKTPQRCWDRTLQTPTVDA